MWSVEGFFMKRNKLSSFTESLGSSQDVLQFFLPWQNGFVSSTETRFSNTSWHWFLIDRSLRGGFLICLGTTDSALQSTKNKQACVSHCDLLPFTLKSILMQKKNYGNSNISPSKNIIFKKNPPKEIKILQDIRTLYNSSQVSIQSQNILFQKSSFKSRPIIYYLGAKIP